MEIVYVAAAIIGWIVGLCAVGELAHAKGFSQVRWIIAAVFFNPLCSVQAPRVADPLRVLTKTVC